MNNGSLDGHPAALSVSDEGRFKGGVVPFNSIRIRWVFGGNWPKWRRTTGGFVVSDSPRGGFRVDFQIYWNFACRSMVVFEVGFDEIIFFFYWKKSECLYALLGFMWIFRNVIRRSIFMLIFNLINQDIRMKIHVIHIKESKTIISVNLEPVYSNKTNIVFLRFSTQRSLVSHVIYNFHWHLNFIT